MPSFISNIFELHYIYIYSQQRIASVFPLTVLSSLSPFLTYGMTAYLRKGESAPVFRTSVLRLVSLRRRRSVASHSAALSITNSYLTTGPQANIYVNRYFRVDILWYTCNFFF